MKLLALSGDPNYPCFILRIDNVTLMLDCALAQSNLQHFLPIIEKGAIPLTGTQPSLNHTAKQSFQENSDFCDLKLLSGHYFIDGEPEFVIPEIGVIECDEIDAILITSVGNGLALPYIIHDWGYKGKVYATEPVLTMIKLTLTDLAEHLDRAPQNVTHAPWKQATLSNYFPISESFSESCWQKCFTQHHVDACATHMRKISFNEKIQLSGRVSAVPVCSGSSIGGVYWTIQSESSRFTYVAGGSRATSHCKPIVTLPALNSDALVMTNLTQSVQPAGDAIGDVCMQAARTLGIGGNLIIPVQNASMLFDLIECFYMYLSQTNMYNNSKIPFYFISPNAKSFLAYVNIFGEFLTDDREKRLFEPRAPFDHTELQQSGKVQAFASLAEIGPELISPCVAFCGHPSLRFGDVVHLIQMWKHNPNNCLMLVEPEFSDNKLLTPYQPFEMKVYTAPIDTRFRDNDANNMIEEVNPAALVTCLRDSQRQVRFNRGHISHYRRLDEIDFTENTEYQDVYMDSALVSNIHPTQVTSTIKAATITGMLTLKDNRYSLERMPPEEKLARGHHFIKQHLYGTVDIQEFVANLEERGLKGVTYRVTDDGYHVQAEGVTINLGQHSARIHCKDPRSKIKDVTRDCIVACLGRF